MPEFRIGQRVEYRNANDNLNLGTGVVEAIEPGPWVVVRFLTGAIEGTRAFPPDGQLPDTGQAQRTEAGTMLANAWGGRLQALYNSEEEQTPMNEHPPEPTIGYGVFETSAGREVTPGYAGRCRAGFGILNLPAASIGLITDTGEDAILLDYLRSAKEQWKQDCLTVDFDNVENKLDFLIGLQLGYTWLYTDQLGTEVRFPVELDPAQRRHQVLFDYSTDCLVTGLVSMTDIQTYFGSGRHTVADVQGDKITMEDGMTFHVTSRYRENRQPKVNVAQSVKALLMQNLVSQRAKRDSSAATPVNDDQAIESVAA